MKPLITQLILFSSLTAALSGCSAFKSSQNAYLEGNPNTGIAESDDPAVQSLQQLNAAAALIAENNPIEAKNYTDIIDPSRLSAADLTRLHLLQTQINLGLADNQQALKHLRLIQPALLSASDKMTFLRSKAVTYSLVGKPLESAQARIELQPLLLDNQQQYENKSATLDTLRLVPLKNLQGLIDSNDGELGGWLALAKLLKYTPQLSENHADYLKWQADFPDHPANSGFLKSYLITSKKSPATIAVFLPESGPYAQAASAIKAGFMAAYAEAEAITHKQANVHFYDSTESEPVTLYHRALKDGAQIIIGPLIKEDVEALANVKVLDIPILTLNHIPGLEKPNLYQFALSPIDEVDQITARAAEEGFKRALVLTPKTELGERIQGYFKTALQKRGGLMLKAKHYNPDASDYSGALKDLLNLTESENRYAKLKRIIPNLQYTPRIRQDIDALFITAYPQNAKNIQNQLHNLTKTYDIPIFATSQIYSGNPKANDANLNNITFCDIPWLFPNSYQGNLSQGALSASWQQFPEIYLRLVAMGIDAYNLMPHLNQLKISPYHGASGKLMLTDENRVQRHLVCAAFAGNKAQLLGNSPQNNEQKPLVAPVP